MFRNVTISLAAASVRWGSSSAATLRDATVTKIPNGWSLTATVDKLDAFKVSQRPLMVVAPHETGSFRWPIVDESLQVNGQSLTATLGPREQ